MPEFVFRPAMATVSAALAIWIGLPAILGAHAEAHISKCAQHIDRHVAAVKRTQEIVERDAYSPVGMLRLKEDLSLAREKELQIMSAYLRCMATHEIPCKKSEDAMIASVKKTVASMPNALFESFSVQEDFMFTVNQEREAWMQYRDCIMGNKK